LIQAIRGKLSGIQNRGQKYLPVFGLPRSLIEFLGTSISLLQDVASLLQISDLNLKATFSPGATFFLGF